jgi:hypothetical protein
VDAGAALGSAVADEVIAIGQEQLEWLNGPTSLRI